MAHSGIQKASLWRVGLILTGATISLSGTAAVAQDAESASQVDYLDKLKTCQLLEDDSERLACFDRSVGEMVAANEAGDVKIVDREDVRQTKRQLFGFSVPEVGILKEDVEKDEKSSEQLATSITSVRYLSRKKVRITTAEGAVWEMNNAPRRLRTIEAGDPVVFKKASLGYYFIRIDGQLGVKGKRVE